MIIQLWKRERKKKNKKWLSLSLIYYLFKGPLDGCFLSPPPPAAAVDVWSLVLLVVVVVEVGWFFSVLFKASIIAESQEKGLMLTQHTDSLIRRERERKYG
jgi:hypothetical protein